MLTLGSTSITPVELATALRVSGAVDVVVTLEDGLDSYVTSGPGGELEAFALPQVVPHAPAPPTLEWFDATQTVLRPNGQAVAEDAEEAVSEKEWTLVDGEKGDTSHSGDKRKTELGRMPYPIVVKGEEATIACETHSPQPFVLSGGQVRLASLTG